MIASKTLTKYEVRFDGGTFSPEEYSGYFRPQNDSRFSYDFEDAVAHRDEIVSKGNYTRQELRIVLVVITETVIVP